MTQVGNPMSVLANLQPKLLGHIIDQRGKEVNVLGVDGCILHAQDTSALELAIFNVKVELTAALGLALVVPVHSVAAL